MNNPLPLILTVFPFCLPFAPSGTFPPDFNRKLHLNPTTRLQSAIILGNLSIHA